MEKKLLFALRNALLTDTHASGFYTYISTAKRFATLFKNEMCFSPSKTKCDLKSNLSAKKQHLKRQKLAQKAS